MIDGGIALFLLGVLLACCTPAERIVAQRRWNYDLTLATAPLHTSFPIVEARTELQHLVAAAEVALDADAARRGIRRPQTAVQVQIEA